MMEVIAEAEVGSEKTGSQRTRGFKKTTLRGSQACSNGAFGTAPPLGEGLGGWERFEDTRKGKMSAAGRAIVERGKANHFSYVLCEMELKAELVRRGLAQAESLPPAFGQGLKHSVDSLVGRLGGATASITGAREATRQVPDTTQVSDANELSDEFPPWPMATSRRAPVKKSATQMALSLLEEEDDAVTKALLGTSELGASGRVVRPKGSILARPRVEHEEPEHGAGARSHLKWSGSTELRYHISMLAADHRSAESSGESPRALTNVVPADPSGARAQRRVLSFEA